MNIIAKNTYAAKNGVKRLVRDIPGVKDLVIHPGLPRMQSGGAVIEMSAELIFNGKPMKLERKGGEAFAIRVNEGQGADAVLGKAERKMCAYILETLTGSAHSVGDVDDLDESTLKNANVADVDISKELPPPTVQPVTSATEAAKQAMNKAAVEKAKENNKKGKSLPAQGSGVQTPPAAATPTPATVTVPVEPAPPPKAANVVNPSTATMPAPTVCPPGKKARVHGFLNGKKLYHDKDGNQTTDINLCADWQDAAPPAAAAPAKTEPAKEAPKPEPAKEAAPEQNGTGEVHTMTCKLAHVGQNKYKPDQRLGFPVKDEHATQYLTFNRLLATDAKKLYDLGKRVTMEYLDSGPIFAAYGKYELISVKEAPAESEPPQQETMEDVDLEIPEDPGQAVENLM